MSDLDRLGFDPVVTDVAGDDDAAVVASPTVRSPSSPQEHPELVCGLHRGLVAGFVAAMADTEVREFCSVTSRTPCRVTVSADRELTRARRHAVTPTLRTCADTSQ